MPCPWTDAARKADIFKAFETIWKPGEHDIFQVKMPSTNAKNIKYHFWVWSFKDWGLSCLGVALGGVGLWVESLVLKIWHLGRGPEFTFWVVRFWVLVLGCVVPSRWWLLCRSLSQTQEMHTQALFLWKSIKAEPRKGTWLFVCLDGLGMCCWHLEGRTPKYEDVSNNCTVGS